MSDTKTLIKYVRDRIEDGPNITFGKPTVCDLVEALEASEHRADKLKSDIDAGAKDYSALMDRHDAQFVRAEKAESEVARLTAERDWLADKVGDAYGKPCDKDLNFTSGDCPMGHLWGDDCCLHTDKPTCWVAEAARKAVAEEGK